MGVNTYPLNLTATPYTIAATSGVYATPSLGSGATESIATIGIPAGMVSVVNNYGYNGSDNSLPIVRLRDSAGNILGTVTTTTSTTQYTYVTSPVASVGVSVTARWNQTTVVSTNGVEGAVIFAGNYYMFGIGAPGVSANPYLYISTNGANWSVNVFGVANARRSALFYDGTWYFVGGGTTGETTGLLWVSTNGTTWTTRAGLTGVNAVTGGYSATAPFKYWICGSNNDLWVSTNGTTWATRLTTPSNLYKVIWNSPYYVAVGGGGFLAISTNGSNWSTRAVNASSQFQDVIYAGGYYVAPDIQTPGYTYVSTDAINWTTRNAPVATNNNAISYLRGYYLVGNGTNSVPRRSSTNLTNWTQRDSLFGTDKMADRGIVANSAGTQLVCVSQYAAPNLNVYYANDVAGYTYYAAGVTINSIPLAVPLIPTTY